MSPCDSSYMAVKPSEVIDLIEGTEVLKSKVDELVHLCDTKRDALEAYFDGTENDFPRVGEGHALVDAIELQITKIKGEYAYTSGGNDHPKQAANVMIEMAHRALREFDRLNVAVDKLKAGRRPTKTEIEMLRQDQIKHRLGDMARVYIHFANVAIVTDADIAKLSNIDPSKPLIPQLGFDPDEV